MLTPSEIDLLRQDLNAALKVIGQDELDEADTLLRKQGFQPREFEILQEGDPSPVQPGAVAGTVHVIRKNPRVARVYSPGSGTTWLVQFAADIKSGVFGAPPAPDAAIESPIDAAGTSIISEAIRKRTLLEFSYDGRLRVVAPYCLGVSTRGAEVLRAIQVRGFSASGGRGFGKLWSVSKMGSPRLLDETFTPDDPNYNPHDSGMTQIYCRV
jgi:hypothetical protein